MTKETHIAKTVLQWGKRTYIMGILNVTPDSFSDGGQYLTVDKAVAQALRMASEGADIIDIGAESTKPGYAPISTEEELDRLLPVIQRLRAETNLVLSVDTYKVRTAELALASGAHMINDIWGLKREAGMARLVAASKAPVCIMHNRDNTNYHNLMEDILADLSESIAIALQAGVQEEQIILDPGIGFAKTVAQNLEVMKHLERLKSLGYPVLLGASRKSFIGKSLGLDVQDRLEGTLASTAIGISKGVDIIRVHDVLQNIRVARMTDLLVRE